MKVRVLIIELFEIIVSMGMKDSHVSNISKMF